MRNFTKKLISGAIIATTLLASASCGGGGSGGSDQATLYVYSFTSGFGSQWLTELIEDFEEVHKDAEIDGKKRD